MRLLVLSLISTLLTATAFGQSYTLTVESSEPVAAEGTVYRFYVNALDPTDKMSAVYGNDEDTLLFSTPEGIFNSPINGSWNASGMNPALFSFFPELQDDSFATIGLDLPASEVVGSEDPSLVQDETLVPTVSNYFQTGGTQLQVNSLLGSSWYVLNAASNSFPDDDGRWLIAQITTSGSISGQLNFQVSHLELAQTKFKRRFNLMGQDCLGRAAFSLDARWKRLAITILLPTSTMVLVCTLMCAGFVEEKAMT